MLASLSRDAIRISGTREERLDLLAADLITLQSEQGAQRGRLIELGWSAPFLDANEAEARKRANARYMRDVNDDPITDLATTEDRMVELVISMLPGKQYIVAEMQARGFTKSQMDLKLPRAIARAAYGFAHGGAAHG